jgi:uncharacterized protein YjbI with pentapeptide repeats
MTRLNSLTYTKAASRQQYNERENPIALMMRNADNKWWTKHIVSFLGPSAEVFALTEKIRNRSSDIPRVLSRRSFKRPKSGALELACEHLEGAYLDRVNLYNADLSGAYLQDANLSLASLQGANLSLAKLQGANLQGANLEGANLERANLQEAQLQGAQLQGADLRDADLIRANLQGANLQGAQLQGANLEEANLERAELQKADLYGANLERAELQGADLQGADLRRTNLEGTCLDLRRYLPNITPDEIRQFISTRQLHSLTDPKYQYLLNCIVNKLNEIRNGSGNLQVFNSAFKNSFGDQERQESHQEEKRRSHRIPPQNIVLSDNRLTRGIRSFLEGQNDTNDTITADALELYKKLSNRITDMSEQDIDRLVLDAVRHLRTYGRGASRRTRRKNKRGKRSKKNKK